MSTQENLEERIERIRKRNEELQKRHAEAEADKQRAKKENAMVQTKLMSYDDWPKEHKYDKVDFTFDKCEDEHNNSNDQCEKKTERFRKTQFAEGDGPPPDPSYSFLKDADRDFNKSEQTKNKINPSEKAQWANQREFSSQQRGRGGHNRGSFRGNNRGKSTRGDFSHHRNDSYPEYDAWRSERNKIDEARINRQRNAEGKWRREWDVEKINNDGPKEINHTHKPEKPTIGDMVSSGVKKAPVLEVKDGNRNRPNITVSLNRTGEVQSVKVTSPPAIGTGRVGPRQMKSRPLFPDETLKEKNDEFAVSHKSRGRHMDGRDNKKKDNSRSPKKNEMYQPTGSVQNRLNKYKQANDFSQLSQELKDVSAEIKGIYNSVENLNKKHGETEKNVLENFGNAVDVSMLIKNHTDVTSEDFSLSTDLVLGSDDISASDYNKSDKETDLKCNFGDMKTDDIENFIEREVLKNNTCLSPESMKITENCITHENIEEDAETNKISDVPEEEYEESDQKVVETILILEDKNEEIQNVADDLVENVVSEKNEEIAKQVEDISINNTSNVIEKENIEMNTIDKENIIIENQGDEKLGFETKTTDADEKSVDVENKGDGDIGVENADEIDKKIAAADKDNEKLNAIQNEAKSELLNNTNNGNENINKSVETFDEIICAEKAKGQIEINNEAILTDNNIEKQA